MLNKDEIRGIVISIVMLILILVGFYLVRIYTMNSWMEFTNDLSKRMAEMGKQIVTYVVQRIMYEIRA